MATLNSIAVTPVFSLDELRTSYPVPEVITVDVKNLKTFLDYSSISRSLSHAYEYVHKRKGINFMAWEEANFVILMDNKNAFFLKDDSGVFKGRVWAKRNKKIQFLFKIGAIKNFMEM